MIQSACLVLFPLTWSPAVDQPTTSISGVVLDETRARMPGATVLLRQLTPASRAPRPAARITSTATPARQVQVGLKLIF